MGFTRKIGEFFSKLWYLFSLEIIVHYKVIILERIIEICADYYFPISHKAVDANPQLDFDDILPNVNPFRQHTSILMSNFKFWLSINFEIQLCVLYKVCVSFNCIVLSVISRVKIGISCRIFGSLQVYKKQAES